MDQLEVVQLVEVLELHGHSIAVKAMYDPSFTRANTFVCSDLNGSLPLRDYHKEVCLIDESSMLLLPIVTQYDRILHFLPQSSWELHFSDCLISGLIHASE